VTLRVTSQRKRASKGREGEITLRDATGGGSQRPPYGTKRARRHTPSPIRGAPICRLIAAVGNAVTFSSSLSESRAHPSRYGVTWDIAAGHMSTPDEVATLADKVRAIPGVVAFAGMGTTAFDQQHGTAAQRHRGRVVG
jgi:hypothetical protein